ncbi:MAG: tRNA uridine-5-carboxymethylaminomethyl(34) synthesis enzyme MnmG [Bacteriovoracaceae bacterium]|nr:tRNA uridine-5-carboxymethylaminomethyl(34) synthesis enzyme MnmG [Bacteriovoracaceae bacterium]
MNKFDLIVVGGGHAGVEAAWIASQFDLDVAIVTLPDVGLASAPCNPSVGGVGKGQVVRELDALGGLMGRLADLAGIQYRTLNDSKGLAVQSTRVQIDKSRYSAFAEDIVSKTKNITVIRAKMLGASSLEGGFLVSTSQGDYGSKKLVMTVGTFLNGKLHQGMNQCSGGRVGVESSDSLLSLFSSIKKRPSRFKTGTPSRLLKGSIDTTKMVEQPSDPQTRNFHCMGEYSARNLPQVSCFLTHTNEKTLEIIRDNKEKSPMYNGQIQGVGARYCPSIEDKAYRYPDRNSHHVFVEPEGLDLDTVYPSGISSSLPAEIQEAFIHTIEGLESAVISIPGYAVEYDVVDTTELNLALEYKDIPGLYFAGQVNGTSGYEEAAGQGWVAGVNAALSCFNRAPVFLSRHDSYIGVMIEDLISNTRDEPYRLFTSRSENRLFIREDNAIIRMHPYRSYLLLQNGLDAFLERFVQKTQILSKICDEFIFPENSPDILEFFENQLSTMSRSLTLSELLKQAWLDPVRTLERVLIKFDIVFSKDVIRTVAIEKKYAGYITRFDEQFEKIKKMDGTHIDWEKISKSQNVSFECRSRIEKIKPSTFGQLKRIEGIRPATLAVVASQAL